MRKVPRVAVVVPCYNYGRYLPTAVESALAQRDVEVHVLIIDDASTDDSAFVGRRLAAVHSNVEFVKHERNQGHIATYNEGLIGWAGMDGYAILLSADDILLPGALARATMLMEAHPSVGMVYGRSASILDDDGVPSAPNSPQFRLKVHRGSLWLSRRCAQAVNVVPAPTAVVRASTQSLVGGYNPRHPHAGDFLMWMRFAAVSDIGYVRGPLQSLYRVHPRSMSQGVYRDPLADVMERRSAFEEFFREHGKFCAHHGIDPLETYRVLASQPLWQACRLIERGESTRESVDRFVDFARETYPNLEALRAYRALRRRERIGPTICHRTQLFMGTAVAHRLQSDYWWARWKRTGG